MTAKEMSAAIGARVYLEPMPGLQVLCTVTNAKTAYGNRRLEIEPVSGAGRVWVNASRVTEARNREAAHAV